MKKGIIIVLLCMASHLSAQNLSAIHLKTLDEKEFSLEEIKKHSATVFVFLFADCPACQSYSLTLNQLSRKFESSDIQFYGVFTGDYNTTAEMKDFQKDYKINFLLLKDPEKKLAKRLSAKVVPEAFVVDETGNILYRGRIDDWMYAVGKKKPAITKHELQDALSSVVSRQAIKIKETKAIGCIIE